MGSKNDSDIHRLLLQKETTLAALERDAAELRKQIDALREAAAALSKPTAYERFLEGSQSVTRGQGTPNTSETSPVSKAEHGHGAAANKTNKRGTLAAAILGSLVKDEGQTIENVLEKVNIVLPIPSSKEAVAKTLSRLAIEGRIQKIGYGSYALL